MRKPRITILLLASIVTLIGFSGRMRQAESTNQSTKLVPVRAGAQLKSQANTVDREIASFGSIPTQTSWGSSSNSNAAKVISLSDDGNALVSEMCSLHLLAHDTDLSLSSQEWSGFATVVLKIQTIRQSYEAEIATSQLLAPGRYRLEIPAYAGVGDALREKFQTELRAELGDAKAAEVLAALGDRLEGRFAGFGVSMQTLDVATGPGGSRRDLEVIRTVTYWNSVEGSDRPTTRREVHFPAFEDPTGDSWSALLAMVKA